MAIGAQKVHVILLLLRDLVFVLLVGLLLGVGLAFGATRWIESFLFGVKPLDPIAFSASVLLITGIALFAACLPARRATRIEPMHALRQD